MPQDLVLGLRGRYNDTAACPGPTCSGKPAYEGGAGRAAVLAAHRAGLLRVMDRRETLRIPRFLSRSNAIVSGNLQWRLCARGMTIAWHGVEGGRPGASEGFFCVPILDQAIDF
jgi:hypothetical protein